MKTMTRFFAAFEGLIEKAKLTNRLNQVKNCIQSNTFDAEAKLLNIEEEKTNIIKEIAVGDSGKLKDNIQKLANLIQKEDSIREQMKLGDKVLALLNEEIEVEEK